jgi:hypothetical protein
MPELREYIGANQRSPYGRWFKELDNVAAAKIVTALVRLEAGNTSKVNQSARVCRN